MKELEKLAKPLSDYLKDNHYPHTAIVVTEERVTVVENLEVLQKGKYKPYDIIPKYGASPICKEDMVLLIRKTQGTPSNST